MERGQGAKSAFRPVVFFFTGEEWFAGEVWCAVLAARGDGIFSYWKGCFV